MDKDFFTLMLVMSELMAESYYAQENNFCHGHLFLTDIERIADILKLQPTVVFNALQKLDEIKLIEISDTYIENTFLILIDWLKIINYIGFPLNKEVTSQWIEGLDGVQESNFKCVFFEESTRKFMSDLKEFFPAIDYDVPFVTLAICNMYIKDYEATGRNFYEDNPVRKMLETIQKELGYMTKEEIGEFVSTMCYGKENKIFKKS